MRVHVHLHSTRYVVHLSMGAKISHVIASVRLYITYRFLMKYVYKLLKQMSYH